MKKVLKIGIIILSVALLATLLTGCGKEEKTSENKASTVETSNGNKVVATRTTTDEEIGTVKEKMEATFDGDELEEVKMIYTFEDEETAQSVKEMYELIKSLSDEDESLKNVDIQGSGKDVILVMSAEVFEENEGLESEDMTKEDLKQALEDEGYTIEK